MKLKPCVERVGRNGEIKIPPDYLKTLGLYPGEEVKLKLAGRHLLVEPLEDKGTKPAKGIVDKLYGALKLDPKIASEVSGDDYPNNPEDV